VPSYGRHTLRVDQIAVSGSVAARIEVPFQRDRLPETAFAPGSRVVVQPGHSLWKIARLTYGQGVRFTVIYAANRDQIRDADRIYPGQIFALPGTDTASATPTGHTAEHSSRSR
jgi:nucleoid-associated protein YgaU